MLLNKPVLELPDGSLLTGAISQDRQQEPCEVPCERWGCGFFSIDRLSTRASWSLLFHFKWLTDPVRVGIKHLTAVQKVGLVRERKNRVLSVVMQESHACTLPSSFTSKKEKLHRLRLMHFPPVTSILFVHAGRITESPMPQQMETLYTQRSSAATRG